MRLWQTVCMDVATPNLYEDVHRSASGLKLLSDKNTALRQPLSFWISLRYDLAFLLFFWPYSLSTCMLSAVIVHSFGPAKVWKAIEEMVRSSLECIHSRFDCFVLNRSRFHPCRSFSTLFYLLPQFVCFTFCSCFLLILVLLTKRNTQNNSRCEDQTNFTASLAVHFCKLGHFSFYTNCNSHFPSEVNSVFD